MATIFMCGPGGARKLSDVPSADQATAYVVRFLARGHYGRVRNPGPGLFIAQRVGFPPDILFVYDEKIFEAGEYNTGPLALNSGEGFR